MKAVSPGPSIDSTIAGNTTEGPPSGQKRFPSDPSGTVISDRPHFVAGISSAQRKMAEADVQLGTAASALHDYQMAFHQNPVGNNAAITRVLLGKNSRSVRYLPADAQINGKGELTDQWDQPIFFHQISGTITEIRSAGPDHVMWTGDDEALR